MLPTNKGLKMRFALYSSLLILTTTALFAPTDPVSDKTEKSFSTFRLFLFLFNSTGLAPLLMLIIYILAYNERHDPWTVEKIK